MSLLSAASSPTNFLPRSPNICTQALTYSKVSCSFSASSMSSRISLRLMMELPAAIFMRNNLRNSISLYLRGMYWEPVQRCSTVASDYQSMHQCSYSLRRCNRQIQNMENLMKCRPGSGLSRQATSLDWISFKNMISPAYALHFEEVLSWDLNFWQLWQMITSITIAISELSPAVSSILSSLLYRLNTTPYCSATTLWKFSPRQHRYRYTSEKVTPSLSMCLLRQFFNWRVLWVVIDNLENSLFCSRLYKWATICSNKCQSSQLLSSSKLIYSQKMCYIDATLLFSRLSNSLVLYLPSQKSKANSGRFLMRLFVASSIAVVPFCSQQQVFSSLVGSALSLPLNLRNFLQVSSLCWWCSMSQYKCKAVIVLEISVKLCLLLTSYTCSHNSLTASQPHKPPTQAITSLARYPSTIGTGRCVFLSSRNSPNSTCLHRRSRSGLGYWNRGRFRCVTRSEMKHQQARGRLGGLVRWLLAAWNQIYRSRGWLHNRIAQKSYQLCKIRSLLMNFYRKSTLTLLMPLVAIYQYNSYTSPMLASLLEGSYPYCSLFNVAVTYLGRQSPSFSRYQPLPCLSIFNVISATILAMYSWYLALVSIGSYLHRSSTVQNYTRVPQSSVGLVLVSLASNLITSNLLTKYSRAIWSQMSPPRAPSGQQYPYNREQYVCAWTHSLPTPAPASRHTLTDSTIISSASSSISWSSLPPTLTTTSISRQIILMQSSFNLTPMGCRVSWDPAWLSREWWLDRSQRENSSREQTRGSGSGTLNNWDYRVGSRDWSRWLVWMECSTWWKHSMAYFMDGVTNWLWLLLGISHVYRRIDRHGLNLYKSYRTMKVARNRQSGLELNPGRWKESKSFQGLSRCS